MLINWYIHVEHYNYYAIGILCFDFIVEHYNYPIDIVCFDF